MSTNPQVTPASALPLELLQATVRRLMPGWRSAVEEFHYLEGGYTNANYRFHYQGDQFVLRTLGPATLPIQSGDSQAYGNANNLVAEIRFRTFLKQHTALNTAPLIAADVTLGGMITGFVDGSLLAEQPPVAQRAISYLQNLHAQLAQVPQTNHYNLSQWIDRWIPEPPSWLVHYLRQRSDLRLLAQGQMQCCHNDLNPYNVIMSAERPHHWTTLDWETAALAHPVFDAVTLHQGLALAKTDVTSIVALDIAMQDWPSLAEFCAAALSQPVTATVLKAALRSYWLREYAWAAAQVRQGRHNPAITEQHRRAREQLEMHL